MRLNRPWHFIRIGKGIFEREQYTLTIEVPLRYHCVASPERFAECCTHTMKSQWAKGFADIVYSGG